MAETHISKTTQLLEESMGENLLDLRLGNDFYRMAPKSQAAKKTIDKLDLTKVKNFVHQQTLL